MKKEVYKSLENVSTLERKAGKVFNPFFETIADVAFARIGQDEIVAKAIAGPLTEILDKNILIGILFKISKRVLIADMNLCREMGELLGNSEEEQYEDYVFYHLVQPAYLKQLFQAYPAWEEALFQVTEFFVRNITEIIQHLYTDQKDINAEFFSTQQFDRIRRITGSGSDTHCENRIVYCVELDNGERIYHKSRVNKGIRFFNEVYEKICQSLNISYYMNPMHMGSDYVWEKEAVYAECTNEQQVQNYFVRLGVILSIFHLCHGGDMHYENMVASGEFPMIIDYETLVQMMPEQATADVKVSNHIIGESVLPIGILPFYGSPGKVFNADFSGLRGGGKQIMDLKVPVIENPGKSTMCIAYKYGETGEQNNRVRLNGEIVNPEHYTHELYKGYEAGYRYILEHKDEMLELLKHMEGAVFRQLFRNTQEYHMILDLSYHPEFMKETGKRREFLENALGIPSFKDRPNILKQEIEDMLKGDVPYFQYEMSSGVILNSEGKPLEKYFEKNGLEFLKERILNRSEEDLNLQKQFMEISLRYSQVERLRNIYESVDKDAENIGSIVDMCSLIADCIYDSRIQVEGHILWMNTRIMTTGVDKRHTYFMELSDRYLYEGTMGMAVFMAAFLKACPEHCISEVYSAIIKDLFSYTDSVLKDENRITGAFLGEGSIVYGYQLLYQITKEHIFLEHAKKHCLQVAEYIHDDIQHDLVGGNAGAIMAFLNMYDLDKDSRYLDMAMQAGERLLAHAVPAEHGMGWKNISNDGLLGGFAHGCAGIMYALARLSAYTNDEKYLDMAYQAFSYEKTLNQPENGGWRDHRSETPLYMKDFKWCHGVAGIVLGWSLASEYYDDMRKMEIRKEISRVLKDYPEIILKEELGLCHGNLGNIIIGHLAGVDAWKKSMEKNNAQSLSVLHEILSEKEGDIIIHEQYDYSLMTGWAGIGYGLLYSQMTDLPGILDARCK